MGSSVSGDDTQGYNTGREKMKYTIIAPAYNEAENVKPLTIKITETMDMVGEKYEILLIDDGSTDETLENLRLLQEKYDTLTVISLAENSGQTVAYQAGFDYAKGERIVTMDSDLEKDPAYIRDMIEKDGCGKSGHRIFP